jgi:SAM-dependent methyltransferase
MTSGLQLIHSKLVFQRRVHILAESLSALLKDSSDIIDIGCGDGTIARRLKQFNSWLQIRGVDVFARAEADFPVIVYDGMTLPFPDKSFDAAMLVDVLHHTADPAATLREAMRVARDSILIKDHIRHGRWSQWMLAFMDWFGNKSYGVNLEYGYLTHDQWEKLFEQLHLEVRDIKVGIDLYPFPFNLIFRPQWQFIAKLKVEVVRSET